MNTTNARPNTGRKWRGALAVLIGMSLLLIGWAPAGAAGDTPEIGKQYCWGFTSTRLINDGISTSAGPFPIYLPAGIYDIEVQTHDNHPSPDYQPLQTEEQVYLVLDSGYTSPFTNDVPSDAEWMTTTFEDVQLGETKALTVKHRLYGTSPNSVNIIKVCFTLVGYIAPPAAVEPDVDEPVIQPPPVAPTTPDVPAAPAAPDVPAAPAAPEPAPAAPAVTTQVEGVTELALTGTSRSQTLAITGIGMVLLGIALTLIDRRQTASVLG